MCQNCNCDHHSGHSHQHFHPHNHNHDHDDSHHVHPHEHPHEHNHEEHHHESKRIHLEHNVLEGNNLIAKYGREKLQEKGCLLINIISSPGSGKTSILESLIPRLNRKAYVIEGDQQTSNDSERLQKLNIESIQINTGNGCHLDANMIENALVELKADNNSIIFIENVGNLVCPSLFDLGENQRIVVISVTEGEDKPLKYPNAFIFANICIINKIDLLPYLKFDIETLIKNILTINPNIKIFEISALTGEGIENVKESLETK